MNRIKLKIWCVFLFLLFFQFVWCAFFSCIVLSQTQVWEIKQNKVLNPIGVDNNNNYLLFYSGYDNSSQTWLIKYSLSGQIIYNDSIDFNYDYFQWTAKKLDKYGSLYLISKGEDRIVIFQYDNKMNFIRNITIFNEVIPYNYVSSELIVTNIGSIYLSSIKEYTILNATHSERIDVLYKINQYGEIVWNLCFKRITERLLQPSVDIAEYQEGFLYFNYYKELYRIDSRKGKIKWKMEFIQMIKEIVAFGEDVCAASMEDTEYSPMTLSYITSNKEKIWEISFSSELGILTLEKLEIKRDKLGLHLLDTIDGEITGECNETFSIITTRGELLISKSWFSEIYFLQRRHFSLSYTDNYYSHYYNHINKTTHVFMNSYEAPPYTPPTYSSPGFLISLEIILGLLIIIFSKRSLKNLASRKNLVTILKNDYR